MKYKFFDRLFWHSFYFLGIGAMSCSQTTKLASVSPASKVDVKNGTSSNLKSANATVSTLPVSQVVVDNLKREMINKDKYLEEKIDAESQARKNADEELAASVKKLELKVTGLSEQLTNQVKRLDAVDTNLSKQIGEQAYKHDTELATLKEDMTKKFSEQAANLKEIENKLGEQIQNVAKETQNQLQQEMAEKVAQLELSDAELMKNLTTKINNDIGKQRDLLLERSLELKSQIIDGDTNVSNNLEAKLAEVEKKLLLSDQELKKVLLDNVQKEITSCREEIKLDKALLTDKINETASVIRGEMQKLYKSLDLKLSLQDDVLRAELKKEINSNVDTLKKMLEAQKTYLEAQLDTKNKSLEDSLKADIKQINEDLKKSDEALKQEFITKIDNNIKDVREQITMAEEGLKTTIQQATGDLNNDLVKKFTEADDVLRNKLQTEMTNKINDLSTTFTSFKEYADKNFSTKAELYSANMVIDNLLNITNLLNKKIDENDVALNNKLTNEVSALRKDLVDKIMTVQANVDDVNNQLNGAISEYKEGISKLSTDAMSEAKLVRKLMAEQQTMNQDKANQLNSLLAGLTTKVADGELYAQKVREALENKISELEKTATTNDEDIRNAVNKSHTDLLAAIAAEQELRQALQVQVSDLATEVERVKNIANQGLTLAKANQDATVGLQAELEKAKETFATELSKLRKDMETKIAEVRNAAENLVADLGKDVQKQAAHAAANLADLKAKEAGAGLGLRRILADLGTADSIEKLLSNTKPYQDKLLVNAFNLNGALDIVSGKFLQAIDATNHKAGVDNMAINELFKPLSKLEACGGNPNIPEEAGKMAFVAGKAWYSHLVVGYLKALLTGARVGDVEYDKIYFGTKALDGKSLQSMIILAALPDLAIETSGECVAKVADWANGIFKDEKNLGLDFRRVVAGNDDLKKAILNTLIPEIVALTNLSNDFEKQITDYVATKLSKEDLQKFLEEGLNNLPSFRAMVAQLMNERVDLAKAAAVDERTTNNLIKIATDIANAKTDAQEKQATLDKIQQQSKILQDKLNEITAIKPAPVKPTEAAIAALSLTAAIAQRLGYADLVAIAKEEAGKLDGAKLNNSLLLPLGCIATSHFYNYANKGDAIVQRCSTAVDKGDGALTDDGKCRGSVQDVTATKSTFTTTTTNHYTQVKRLVQPWIYRNGNPWTTDARAWGYALCVPYWENLPMTKTNTTSTRVLSAEEQVKVGEVINGASFGDLKAKILHPEDPVLLSIANRPEGSPYPADGQTAPVMEIYGNAHSWQIDDMNAQKVVVKADKFRVKDGSAGIRYAVPVNMFFMKDEKMGFTQKARVTALDATGKAIGASCIHGLVPTAKAAAIYDASKNVQVNLAAVGPDNITWVQGAATTSIAAWLYSPIVLDFSNTHKVSSIAPEDSDTYFDLNSDGIKEKTGWINRDAGFLVLDKNGDGIINNGGELFGNRTTLLSGKFAYSGYEALSEYDINKDAFITKKDAVFAKLQVWRDYNKDGISQPNELTKLAKLGITKIGTMAEHVALEKQMLFKDKSTHNYVFYQSVYFGPKNCPTDGCKSFDIFFGVDGSIVASK